MFVYERATETTKPT